MWRHPVTSASPAADPSPVIPEKILHFIGGQQLPSVGGGTFDVADPATNQVYAQVAAGDADDVDKAVEAAAEAFKRGPWARLAARARAKILNRIADGIEARGGEIAALETFDTGLPITQAKGQAARAAENFRYFADVIVAQHEDAFSQPGQLGYVLRKPAGVAGLITPWNTPFMLESWKLAPALASGLRGGAEAGRVDAAVGVAAAGDHDRGGRARRRVQHRARHRRVGRRGAGRAPGRAADLVHRRDHDRADDHARRPPITSRGCRWSSAGSRRASSSPTPIWTRRSTPRCSG